MLENVRSELSAAIAAALADLGVVEAAVTLDVPPRRQLGDLAWAGALPLAKTLRRAPRAIAEELATAVASRVAAAPPESPLAFLEPTVHVEGPGFVNFRLRRGPALAAFLQAPTQGGEREEGRGESEPSSGSHASLRGEGSASFC